MTKSQIFFYLLLAFILGVAIASFLPVSIPVLWAFFVWGGLMAVFAVLQIRERPKIVLVGFMLMASALGMFWFWRASRVVSSPLDTLTGQRIIFGGTVYDEPAARANSQRLVVLEPESRRKILITTRPHPEYRYGDELKISGRLEYPENFSPDFDYAAYLAKEDIFYTMVFPEIEILDRGKGNPIYQFLFRLKSAFAQKLERYLPEPHAAFASGLILGERKSMPQYLTDELRITGTSHIVALSGYNITIVADALMKTLMFFFVPFSLAFWLAASGIIGFTMLTGAAASVVRAAIMGLLVLISRREGRWYRMRNALTLAAAMMVFHNPKVLRFDVAFQLSFLATLGLIYGAPILERWYESAKLKLIPPLRRAHLIREMRDRPKRRRSSSFLRQTLVSTLSAQFFVLPLLVYQFGTLSLISPVANLAVIPFIPATMFFGFFTGGLSFLGETLGRLAAAPSWVLLEYELSSIRAFAGLPWASLEIRGFGLVMLVGGYGLIGYWLWKNHRSNPKRNSIAQ